MGGPKSVTDRSGGRAPFAGLFGWAMFDWATQPFYTLILTFIFAPYFATVVVGNPVEGQAQWGYLAAVAGLIVALSGPVLGAIADATGRRKPWIAGFSIVLMAGMSALWFALPGIAVFPLIAIAFIAATVAAEFAAIFTNAMMPQLVPARELGRLSGWGWALGYVGGLVSLVLMLAFVVADPQTQKTLLGLEPLFGLDQATHADDRFSGPFSAVWFGLFAIPFFLFTPDGGATRAASGAIKQGLRELWGTIRDIAHLPPIAIFLLARMLYSDGLAALFAFGGIYGAGLFGWQSFELGLFGISLTIAGALGAVAGGIADDRFGPKQVIVGALIGLLIGTLGIVSIDATRVLFVIEVTPETEPNALFASVGERVYLCFALLIGVLAGPLQAASRSLLARLAPPDKMTQYFGLFAFSGKITAFLAPLLIATVTEVATSQRAGVAVIILFFAVGLALMARLRAG
jgi:UMF1 family MFS transporter